MTEAKKEKMKKIQNEINLIYGMQISEINLEIIFRFFLLNFEMEKMIEGIETMSKKAQLKTRILSGIMSKAERLFSIHQ